MSAGQYHPNTYKNSKPPPGYIPGLGRGAIGFTTRSDIGPARAAAGAAEKKKKETDYSETNFDKFSGYSEKLFDDTPYDADDQEADRVYAAVEERMDGRRKRQREENLKNAMARYRVTRPRIVDQFVDLKAGLGTVSKEQWMALPDGANFSQRARHKRQQQQNRSGNFAATPVPDSVLNRGAGGAASGTATSISALQQHTGGAATPAAGTSTEMRGLAQARGTVLSLKLAKMGDSVSGQTVVDPKGYLTDLNSIHVDSEAEVGDYKKADLLLHKLIESNPRHAPGWIALARLQKAARKLALARKVIKKGCEACPENEDVWLEAAKLATPDNAAVILANAVRHIPNSVKVWMYASNLETDAEAKKAVLRRALTFIPNSVRLWKAAIQLEDRDDARTMLARAVECVPQSVDMWLALARLETYANAQRVLNAAHVAIPSEPVIWVAAAKLEEAQGHSAKVDKVIAKAVTKLGSSGVHVDREAWLKHAEECEAAGAKLTCSAIVRHTIGLGVEDEDRKRTWLADAAALEARGSMQCARAVYAHTLSVFPKKASIWRAAAALEKAHGTSEALEALLREAVGHCPHAEVLWLMAAKERWLGGDVDTARTILQEAFKANPGSEQVWLAAAKLEWENDRIDGARMLLQRARERAPTPRVWVKSALLERETGHPDRERELLAAATRDHPTAPKLWMMAGQAAEAAGDAKAARTAYQTGLRYCHDAIPLWCLSARLHEAGGQPTRARNVLEMGRVKNPRTPALWLEAVRLERRAGQGRLAETLLAKALQECPTSGLLWAEDIRAATRAGRRRKVEDALHRCGDDPHVVVEVARFFVSLGKYSKARKWFKRAVTLDPDLGDAWAAFYAFELAHGNEEQQSAVADKCEASDPRHGEAWNAVVKRPEHRRKGVKDKLRVVVADQARRAAAEKKAAKARKAAAAAAAATRG